MPPRLIRLVAFHVALAPALLAISFRVVQQQLLYLPIVLAALGTVLGQFCLLVLWLAMGTNPLRSRLLGTFLAAVYLVSLFPVCREPFDPTAWDDSLAGLGVALVGMWLFAAGIACVRRWIGRIVLVPNPARLPRARPQFTVSQVLLLTAVVAILFGLRRVISSAWEQSFWYGTLINFAYLAVVLAIDLLLALWATLGGGRTAVRLPLVLVMAAAMGLLFAQVAPYANWWGGFIIYGLLSFAAAVVVVASLLVVRSCGYRLVPVGAPAQRDDETAEAV